MPNVYFTLRHISQWRHIIKSDFMTALIQIHFAWDSMKYCGIIIPFKVFMYCIQYVQFAMCLPDSETALEKLMCSVLSHLPQEGTVVKTADNIYCKANT